MQFMNDWTLFLNLRSWCFPRMWSLSIDVVIQLNFRGSPNMWRHLFCSPVKCPSSHLHMWCIYIYIYIYEFWYTMQRLGHSGKQMRELLKFKMRCIQTILGMSRKERVQNKCITKLLGNEEIVVIKIIKSGLRWFGHVIYKDEQTYIGWTYIQDFRGRRAARRLPERWDGQVMCDTNLSLPLKEWPWTENDGKVYVLLVARGQ